MILYWFIVAVMMITALYATSKKVTNRIYAGRYGSIFKTEYAYELGYNFFIIAVLSFFWFLTAFRGVSIGNDTQTYVNYFNAIAESGVNSDYAIELGYQYLCLFVSYFTSDAQIFLIFVSTLLYLGIGIYVFKFSKNKAASLCLVFCLCFSNFTNLLRQDIAMVIVLYAYQLIKHKRGVLGLLLILLAAQFHVSAYVAVLLYFHKFYPKNGVAVALISLAVIVLSVSGVVTSVLSNILVEYKGYFNSEYQGSGYLAVSVSLLQNAVIYLIIRKAYSGDKSRQASFVIGNVFILLILTCFGYSVNQFTRASTYFLYPCISELPNAFYRKEKPLNKSYLALLIVFLSLYFILTLYLRPEWNNLYPYEFWS